MRRMLAKYSNCFLFLTVGCLMLFSPLSSKAQNSSVGNLAGTIWGNDKKPIRRFNANDNSVTEFIYYIYFHQQGKAEVKYIVDKSAGAVEKYEWEYVTRYDGTLEYKQVRKLSRTPPSVNGYKLEGTYRIKGRIIYLDFPDFTIEVTFSETSMEGVLTSKDTKKDEVILFTKTEISNASSPKKRPSYSESDPFAVSLECRNPNIICSGENITPIKGYRWVKPDDPEDFRVEKIP